MNTDKFVKETSDSLANSLRQMEANSNQKSKILREIFDTVCDTLLQDAKATDYINAPNAVLEIIDGKSGCLYRRYLELDFQENDNGIRLSGEDLSGNPAQIVFLSSTALQKMHELQGKGPNEPRCDDHK